MSDFLDNLEEFLISLEIPFEKSHIAPKGAVIFYYSQKEISLVALPLSVFDCGKADLLPLHRAIYIFEDRWRYSLEAMKAHIMTSLGLCGRIFARNCAVRNITAEQASDFLRKNHIYGNAKSKYRYGLFRVRRSSALSEMDGENGELVAVATFSASRNITIDVTKNKKVSSKIETDNRIDGSHDSEFTGSQLVSSYEWVRYASIMGVRVVGGMGKLLGAFIQEVRPEDIMTYADLEWSDGGAYRQLGFIPAGERREVVFAVNLQTMERVSVKKIECDRKYRDEICLADNLLIIHNLGSSKWRLSPKL